MAGIDFEKRLEVLFNDLGYKGKRTPASGDFGADLVIENNKGRTVVQAKRSSKAVGVKAIQEVTGSKAYYNAGHAIVVTNNIFTQQAKKLANMNCVELWDREILISKLYNSERTSQPTILSILPKKLIK